MQRKELIDILSISNPEITEDYTDSDLIEYVTCLKRVHSEEVDECRWWSMWEDVYEVEEGTYLKYTYPKTTGDRTPYEVGYEDDGLDNIWVVERKEILTYIYE